MLYYFIYQIAITGVGKFFSSRAAHAVQWAGPDRTGRGRAAFEKTNELDGF